MLSGTLQKGVRLAAGTRKIGHPCCALALSRRQGCAFLLPQSTAIFDDVQKPCDAVQKEEQWLKCGVAEPAVGHGELQHDVSDFLFLRNYGMEDEGHIKNYNVGAARVCQGQGCLHWAQAHQLAASGLCCYYPSQVWGILAIYSYSSHN